VLQVLDSLEVVSFLVQKKHLEALEHLNQVVPLANQVHKRDGFEQLLLPLHSAHVQVDTAEVSLGVKESEERRDDRQTHILLVVLNLFRLLLLGCQ